MGMGHTATAAATVTMIDQTCDEPFTITVEVVHDAECVGCDKPLDGRLAVLIHDSIDPMMTETMCLGCFDASVDSAATRIIDHTGA
jgi:hypothetical protein